MFHLPGFHFWYRFLKPQPRALWRSLLAQYFAASTKGCNKEIFASRIGGKGICDLNILDISIASISALQEDGSATSRSAPATSRVPPKAGIEALKQALAVWLRKPRMS